MARTLRSVATVRAARGRRRRSRGQALVELSVLAPVLISLSLGTTDFGRAFGLNEAINGAAREAARQAAYYDYTSASNPLYLDNTGILQVAKNELGSTTGAKLSYQASGTNPCASSPPSGDYPATPDTGYLYICRTSSAASADGRAHVTVAILWRMSLITPIAKITGVPLLHGTVDATEQGS